MVRFLEQIIGAMAPGLALKRTRARAASAVLAKNERRYEAAGWGRRTEGWLSSSTGANAENRGAIRPLRDRMRDLVRNNPYAKRAVRIIASNAVGSGIRPAPKGKKGDNTRVAAAWKLWAETTACDFEGQRNLFGMQRSIMRAAAESGECLVLRKRLSPEETQTLGRGINFQLQILEADYLDSGRDQSRTEGGGRIIQGVEFNTQGRRVAYWLFKGHPGDGVVYDAMGSIRIPAADVLHVYEILRPGQVRGVPMGVSSMLRLRDFDDYEDAQLVRQKIAACYTAFYTGSEMGADAINGTNTVLPDRLQPGMIEQIPAGGTVTFANPPPADQYDEYSRRVLQGIAAGFGVTYEQLTGDYSNVNFTSGRMGRLEFEEWIAELQDEMLVMLFCVPVWQWFVNSMYLAGAIRTMDLPVKWTPPARKLVDPVKEAKALKDMVRAGFDSYSSAAAALGRNPDELRAEIEEDNKEADRLGLRLTSDPRKYGDNGTPVQMGPGGELPIK